MRDPSAIEVEHLRAIVAVARARLRPEDAALAADMVANSLRSLAATKTIDAVERLRADALALVFAPSARAILLSCPQTSAILALLPATRQSALDALGLGRARS